MSSHKLECRILPPQSGAEHTHTVIFLHGRGSTATTFVEDIHITTDSQGRALPDIFPSFRWVLPESEIRPLARFPMDQMHQWFDTWDIQNLADHEELQLPGLRESVDSIRTIFEEELQHVGGEPQRIILAGVSQGGAVAAHTLVNLNIPGRQLGGLMTFSARFPFPGRNIKRTRELLALEAPAVDDYAVLNTPVLWQHCADDRLVKIEYGRQLRDSFLAFGSKVTWKEYAEGGHWIKMPEGIEDAVAWLKKHVLDGTGINPEKEIGEL